MEVKLEPVNRFVQVFTGNSQDGCEVVRTAAPGIRLSLGGNIWHIGRMESLKHELDRLHASVCKGLADPKRLLIINALRDGELSVSSICDLLDLPQSNVSQHLGILRDKGLVTSRREGQKIYYSLTSLKLVEAMDLMRELMAEQLPGTTVGVAG